jgi:molybdenum cofactor cytidylyltransferase
MRRLAVLVLAAGRGERFGGAKQVALLDGKPLLVHVLDAVAAAKPDLSRIEEAVVVTGFHAGAVEAALAAWQGALVVRAIRNPDPARGLSSSLQAGLAALGPAIEGALVILGDQPRISPEVMVRVVDAWAESGARIVAARYAGGGGRNPVLLDHGVWPLAESLTGDRGLGPLLDADPDLALLVDVPGSNPDVDTARELAALDRA